MTNFEQDGAVSKDGHESKSDTKQRLYDELHAKVASSHLSIDEKYTACDAKAASTAGSISCADEAAKAWDKELNDSYKSIKKTMDPEQKNSLTIAERQWMKFRDADFDSINEIYDGHGTMAHPWAAFAQMDIVKQRAIDVQVLGGDTTNGANGARGDQNNPIDEKMRDCQSPDSPNHMMTIDCLGQNMDDWDDKLNTTYKELMTNLNPEQEKAERQSEREWIKFKDLQFDAIDSMLDSRYQGNRIESIAAKTDITRQRTQQLQKRLEIATEDF